MAAKDKTINLQDKVEVIGTGKYAMLAGKKYSVHPINAGKLVKKGAATLVKEPKEPKA